MRGLIQGSLNNKPAVTVFALAIILLGGLSLLKIPIDILPVFKSPAVMVLTFYGGMPPQNVERDITNPLERWTGMAPGIKRQESRSTLGASVIYNYFYSDADPGEALTTVASLAQSESMNLPPGTLPSVVLPFDPTATTPVCLVALNSKEYGETTLYDVGRYEVRNQIMAIQGAVSPVVFGGKIRAVQIYLDRQKMQARGLAPLDVMKAIAASNVFLPSGELIIGQKDYFIDSNAMLPDVESMGEIPLRTKHGNRAFVRDIATPKDDSLIQTSIVRVDGRKQVYIPVMRQKGASTVEVVDQVKAKLPQMETRLTRPGIKLEVIMDQSVYVRQSIKSLAIEAGLGALLCSLVILLFLDQPRMTAIAVLTLPISALAAAGLLFVAGETINVMTLSGLALAIGPMVDIAIVCLENTDRLLASGRSLREAAFEGASEVALPELAASLSTLMVLAPMALMPGVGSFLFRPMALAVAFAMGAVFILAMSMVPVCCVSWLNPRGQRQDGEPQDGGTFSRWMAKWQAIVQTGIQKYLRLLDRALEHAALTVTIAFGALVIVIAVLALPLRREFFPIVDGGAFEMYVRAPSGSRLEFTNDRVAEVEEMVRKVIPAGDLKLIVSQLGLTPDWSAAYTKNSGKMDATMRIQLTEDRDETAQYYVHRLRETFARDRRFAELEFAFNAGGLIRGALNEGKVTPINIRVTSKKHEAAYEIADLIRRDVAAIEGVVDARVMQRQDYPQYVIDVDRAKAADLGLSQEDVMKSVIAALNSSILFNKNIFWIDHVTGNQYFVGVQYPLEHVESLETLLNVPVTGARQTDGNTQVASLGQAGMAGPAWSDGQSLAPTPLSNLVKIRRTTIGTEAAHINIRPTIDVSLNVHGRDLGHVADDVHELLDKYGEHKGEATGKSEQLGTTWHAYDPSAEGKQLLEGADIVLSGEYSRMKQTFRDLGIGLALAVILIFFMLVALTKSFLAPLCVLLAVPLILVGVMPMLFVTQTSINVQSLLGVIFTVGIFVANTVLLTQVAQEFGRDERLSPGEAIRKAAAIRVRPVTMTALAAFFAMVPTALALEKGSEANAPLGRAILGGLLAGEPATLFVVPALYSLILGWRSRREQPAGGAEAACDESQSPDDANVPADR